MALSIVTPPKLWPVTLDEMTDHLRVTATQEDSLIFDIIRGATYWAENRLRWRLLTQTWKYYLNKWPTDIINLPYPPLQSVTHMKYYNASDVQTTLVEDTNYRVDTVTYPARIESITSWPATYDKVLPIEIQFICGFTHRDSIEDPIKDAIKLRAADLYENRQDSYMATGPVTVTKNTKTAEEILHDYKLYNAVV